MRKNNFFKNMVILTLLLLKASFWKNKNESLQFENASNLTHQFFKTILTKKIAKFDAFSR